MRLPHGRRPVTASSTRHMRMAVGAVAIVMLAVVVVTAPERPGAGESWRWLTISLGLVMCACNATRAVAAFGRVGPISVVGFLHLWAFFAASFPAAEMTYRYEQIGLGLWSIPTDTPLPFVATVLLAVFQLIFFLALGERVDAQVVRIVESARMRQPHQRVGLVFLVLLVPMVLARILVVGQLGVQGMVTTMVTRVDYFSQLASTVNPLIWALNTAFPVYAVAFGCLAVKFLVPHPSRRGRWLFLVVLVGSAAGVAISGGRAELVFVVLTVGTFMYVAGYRTGRDLLPLVVPAMLVGGLLFTVAQARHGDDNFLAQAASGVVVGNDYSNGDITQVLGVGRFDAFLMILDRHVSVDNLDGQSYLGAMSGALQATFLPRIAANVNLPAPNVSGEVLGPWVFGSAKASVLPSAPGEAYINFGIPGVLVAGLLLGLITRGLIGTIVRLSGAQELTLVLLVWTIARLISDESSLIARFCVQNWPVVVVAVLVAWYAQAGWVSSRDSALARTKGWG